jgi:hypothetical protein
MENQNNRLITYPSTVVKGNNYTVILVDCTTADFGDLLPFLKTSRTDFDVYTYVGSTGDLEWLSNVGQTADAYLINDSSQVTISNNIRYGQGLEYASPLDYFNQIEQLALDKAI